MGSSSGKSSPLENKRVRYYFQELKIPKVIVDIIYEYWEPITDKEIKEIFARTSFNDKNKKEIYLGKLQPREATAIGFRLYQFRNLERMYLQKEKVRKDSDASVSPLIPPCIPVTSFRNKQETKINLAAQNWGDTDAILIAALLLRDPSTTDLNLGDNNIGACGTSALSASIARNKNLVTFSLAKNRLDREGGVEIGYALEHNTTLTQLNLQNNQIGNDSNDGVIALGRALGKNSTLQTIFLGNNGISTDAINPFADALKRNSSLEKLQLTPDINISLKYLQKKGKQKSIIKKKLTDVEAIFIARLIDSNTRLTKLELWDNNITDEGATAFSECLMKNCTLTALDLTSNKIMDKGAYSLAEGLQANSIIKELKLSYNRIGLKGKDALKKIKNEHPSLTSLGNCFDKQPN